MKSQLPIINSYTKDNLSPFMRLGFDNINFLFDFFEDSTIPESEYETCKNLLKNNYNAIFGGYIILAIYLELQDNISTSPIENVRWLQEMRRSSQSLFYQFVHDIFVTRFRKSSKYDHKIKVELNKCNFNEEQRKFIWKWIRKEINLVAINELKEEFF